MLEVEFPRSRARELAGVRRGRQPPRPRRKSENDHQNWKYLLLKLKELVAISGHKLRGFCAVLCPVRRVVLCRTSFGPYVPWGAKDPVCHVFFENGTAPPLDHTCERPRVPFFSKMAQHWGAKDPVCHFFEKWHSTSFGPYVPWGAKDPVCHFLEKWHSTSFGPYVRKTPCAIFQ